MTQLLAALIISGLTVWVCCWIGGKVDEGIKEKNESKNYEIEVELAKKYLGQLDEFVENLIKLEKIKPEDKEFVVRAIIYREHSEQKVYFYIDLLDKLKLKRIK